MSNKYEYKPVISYFADIKYLWSNDYDKDFRAAKVRAHIRENLKLDCQHSHDSLKKTEIARYYGAPEYVSRRLNSKYKGKIIAKARAIAAKREGAYLVDDPKLTVVEYLSLAFMHLSYDRIATVEPMINTARHDKTWEKIDLSDIASRALPDRAGLIHSVFADVNRLHHLHVSEESPVQIAYYPTLKMFRQDRPVRTTLGKYLTRHASVFGLDESQVKSIAEYYLSRINAKNNWSVTFETTKRGWIEAYESREVRSCMQGEEAVSIYAHEKSTLKLACLRNGANEVIGRCIVRDEGDMTGWLRVYPDPNGSTEGRFLLDYLKTNGYPERTNLNGCLLDYQETYNGDILCPYLDTGEDGTQDVDVYYKDGKQYLLVTSGGDYCADRTDGVLERQSSCECCGDTCHEDDLTYVGCDERSVCEYCRDENYTSAKTRHGWEYVRSEDAVEVDGKYYYQEHLDYFDIYYCEIRDEYYHMDDLFFFDEGVIHRDEAVSVDFDHDGNDFIHPSCVHTLSNGSTCHVDDADACEAEIAEQNEDICTNV